MRGALRRPSQVRLCSSRACPGGGPGTNQHKSSNQGALPCGSEMVSRLSNS